MCFDLMHLYALLDNKVYSISNYTQHIRALTYLAQGQHNACQVLASTAYPPALSADDATRKVAIWQHVDSKILSRKPAKGATFTLDWQSIYYMHYTYTRKY